MSKPSISRQTEASLYRFLQRRLHDDALRYELIAKKVQKTADGIATRWERGIALDWLREMRRCERPSPLPPAPPKEPPFAAVHRGEVGNPYYQAFLDTLEQAELDAITSNAPYFAWHAQRQGEATKLRVPLGLYLRQWADAHLSNRAADLRRANHKASA